MEILEEFNKSLNEIRLSLHKYGKINDSNAKLDEVSKLLAIKLHSYKKDKDKEFLKLLWSYNSEDKNDFVKNLQLYFSEIANDSMFKDSKGESIFGKNPRLEIDEDDHLFAHSMVKMIDSSLNRIMDDGENFDIINETFGHFIRNNFRNNIEDAQYMTPQEVVDLVCDIAYESLSPKSNNRLVVCDPCCGVGSFLTSFYRKYSSDLDLSIVGQDKVQRMVRLSKLNMVLFDSKKHTINKGNSLIGNTEIDEFKGKIDLILTNPPFGASFNGLDLQKENEVKYPLLFDVFKNNGNINSEILFVDRCLGLLKEGGELLAVVPDSVISSKGIADKLRYRIMSDNQIELKSIIELPTVTFAQAGTRTKTSILHLRKLVKGTKSTNQNKVFIGKSTDLGFDVSIRKGATVKIKRGENDLLNILKAYKKRNESVNKSAPTILSSSPSCVLIDENKFKDSAWTPSHYDASIFAAIQKLEKNKSIELTPLKNLVNFITSDRKKEYVNGESKCISILHIVNGDILDYKELLEYHPKYSGIACREGDLLFSKINPRIPRALVVPNLPMELTCSSEFEIIESKCGINNYGIKTLLMLPSVQVQINHLTSGTSSSHNRIKTKELKEVIIPIPKKRSKGYSRFMKLLEKSEIEHRNINKMAIERIEVMNELSEVF